MPVHLAGHCAAQGRRPLLAGLDREKLFIPGRLEHKIASRAISSASVKYVLAER